MTLKWTADMVIREIQELAIDGVLYASNHPALASAAKRLFGTWDKACQAAGIMSGRSPKVTKLADVSAGIRTDEPIRRSLCWSCTKSGASLDNRCSWDARPVLPAGAVYQEVALSSCWSVYKISQCPEYEQLADPTRGYKGKELERI